MRPNLAALIKDEVVRRFEDVVKEEIRTHNIAVRKTEDKIATITERLVSIDSKIAENNSICHGLHLETRKFFLEEREDLEDDFKKEREFIVSFSKSMDEKIKHVDDVLCNSCSKSDLDKMERSIFKHCNETYYDMLNSVECFKEYLHANNSSVHEKLLNRLCLVEESNKELREKLELYRSSSSSQKVESDSVLRELQVYKRSMFIIDKKIENLYTLIERLSARNSL